MNYWTTKDGDEIAYKDLDDNHLLNIIKLINKKAIEGCTICSGGGHDPDEMWYDEETIYGEDVKQYFHLNDLMREAKKRNVIKQKKYYIVTMYRWGNKENYSYTLGVYSTKILATKAGREEQKYRGGLKYVPEVVAYCLDDKNSRDIISPIKDVKPRIVLRRVEHG